MFPAPKSRLNCPSCGVRRSVMSMRASTLMRVVSCGAMSSGSCPCATITPSMR